jgi:predicted nucleic acid-binding protein
MYFIDSWAWIEYFKPRTAGERVKEIIEGKQFLATSTTVVAEVYFKVLSEVGEEAAVKALEFMKKKAVIASLDEEVAVAAARIKHGQKLALADAFALAASNKLKATLVTGDPDFKKISGVLYLGS